MTACPPCAGRLVPDWSSVVFRSRRTVTVLGVLAVFGAMLHGPVSTASAAAGVSLSDTAVPAAADFATRAYADSWDFVNAADLSLSAGRAGNGVSNPFLQDGVYYADVASGGWLNLVQTISGAYPTAATARCAHRHRHLRSLSVRMYSDKADVAKVWWNNCPEMALSCSAPRCSPPTPGGASTTSSSRSAPTPPRPGAARWSASGSTRSPTGAAG